MKKTQRTLVTVSSQTNHGWQAVILEFQQQNEMAEMNGNLPNACWLAGICVNIFWKYGEHTDNTSRWAFTNCPSAANVTSTKSPRHNDS